MSQPPYPPPGGSDTGDDRPAGPPPQNPSARPYPEWQPAPDAASPPHGGQPPYPGPPQYGQPRYGQPRYGQPPYGQPRYGQPAYGQPPYGWRPDVKPGVVPLRPLGLGELLDGAVGVLRRYPRPALGLAALIAVITTLLDAVLLLTAFEPFLTVDSAALGSGDTAQLEEALGGAFAGGAGAPGGGAFQRPYDYTAWLRMAAAGELPGGGQMPTGFVGGGSGNWLHDMILAHGGGR